MTGKLSEVTMRPLRSLFQCMVLAFAPLMWAVAEAPPSAPARPPACSSGLSSREYDSGFNAGVSLVVRMAQRAKGDRTQLARLLDEQWKKLDPGPNASQDLKCRYDGLVDGSRQKLSTLPVAQLRRR